MLKRWERVMRAVQGLPVDRVPLGELVVDPVFCLKALGREAFSFKTARDFWERFALDLVVLPWANTNDACSIARWRQETDCFVFALVDGGFSKALSALGFKAFMEETLKAPDRLKATINDFFLESLEASQACVEAGAHGIMIGDDLAYQKATYISPASLRELYFPSLGTYVRGLKETGAVVFFHSDGNLNAVIGDLLEAGIDGLQSLEPGAGMDLGQIKAFCGHQICLMGNMDLAYLQPETADSQLLDKVSKIMAAGKPGGRFIFGTCSGFHEHVSVEKVTLMIEEALKQGDYSFNA